MTSSSGSRCPPAWLARARRRAGSSSTRPSCAPRRVRSRCTAARWHLTCGDVAVMVAMLAVCSLSRPPMTNWAGRPRTRLLGLAAWSEGDLDSAFVEYTDSIAGMQRIGHIADILGLFDRDGRHPRCPGAVCATPQRLDEQGLQLVADHGAGPLRGTADMHVGLAEILRERDDREAAAEGLQRAQDVELFGTRQYPYRSWAVRAGLRLRKATWPPVRRPAGGSGTVLTTPTSPPPCVPSARRRCTCVRPGRRLPRGAVPGFRERNLSPDDELRYVTEFEHITLAIIFVRIHPANANCNQVSAMLDRLLAAAEAGGRGSSVIEILAVQALAFDVGGVRRLACLAALRRAVARRARGLRPGLRLLGRGPARCCGKKRSRPARPGSARRNKGSSTRSATASSTCCGCCAAISADPTSHASSRCP